MQLSKFSLLFLSFSVLPSVSYGKTVDHSNQFKGLSVGINTGFTHISAHTSWVNHIPGITDGKGGRYATTAKGGTLGGHLIYGYVSCCKMFYMGGEITGSYNFPRGTTTDNVNYGLVYRYSLKDNYTAALRAGFITGKALLYLKAGAAVACRKVEARYLSSQPLNAWKRSTKYQVAPMVGFGFDVSLHEKVACGLESVYTQYPSDKFIYPSGASYRMKTETYDFKLKVTYKV